MTVCGMLVPCYNSPSPGSRQRIPYPGCLQRRIPLDDPSHVCSHSLWVRWAVITGASVANGGLRIYKPLVPV